MQDETAAVQKYATSLLPGDYVVVLMDMLYDVAPAEGELVLPPFLEALPFSVFALRPQLAKETDQWNADDWRHVTDMLSLVAISPFPLPPLVMDGGKLLDGYHRVCAAMYRRVKYLPAIQLRSVLAMSLANTLGNKEEACTR